MGVGFCADLSWLIQSSCGNNVAYVCEQVHKSLSGLESILVHVSRHIINTPLSDVHSESPSVLFQRLFSAAHSYRRLSKAAVHAQLSLWLVAYTRPWILGQWNVPNTSRYTSRALRSRAQSQSIEGPKLWPNTFSALFFSFFNWPTFELSTLHIPKILNWNRRYKPEVHRLFARFSMHWDEISLMLYAGYFWDTKLR